jgi:hypothetical protein
MIEHFDRFISNLSSNNFNENKHLLACEDFNHYLEESIKICEKNSHGGEDEYWFIVLDQLYDISIKLKNSYTEKMKVYFDEFNTKLSKDIKDLLEKMCSYVKIQAVLNVKKILITFFRI